MPSLTVAGPRRIYTGLPCYAPTGHPKTGVKATPPGCSSVRRVEAGPFTRRLLSLSSVPGDAGTVVRASVATRKSMAATRRFVPEHGLSVEYQNRLTDADQLRLHERHPPPRAVERP